MEFFSNCLLYHGEMVQINKHIQINKKKMQGMTVHHKADQAGVRKRFQGFSPLQTQVFYPQVIITYRRKGRWLYFFHWTSNSESLRFVRKKELSTTLPLHSGIEWK